MAAVRRRHIKIISFHLQLFVLEICFALPLAVVTGDLLLCCSEEIDFLYVIGLLRINVFRVVLRLLLDVLVGWALRTDSDSLPGAHRVGARSDSFLLISRRNVRFDDVTVIFVIV